MGRLAAVAAVTIAKVRSVNWSPDEWLAGTVVLTAVEKGCYDTVLNLIYSKGGPIDDDPVWLARNCRCDPRTWKAARRRLLELGKIQRIEPSSNGNGGVPPCGQLTNSRCERELYKARERMFRRRSRPEVTANPMRTGGVYRGRSST